MSSFWYKLAKSYSPSVMLWVSFHQKDDFLKSEIDNNIDNFENELTELSVVAITSVNLEITA